jgi:adenine phosphoribosyltransferase
LQDHIRIVRDFPRPGMGYKDITPLLASASMFASAVDALTDCLAQTSVEKVIGIDAKGFILAAPIALRLGAGFVPLRKAGKLPSLVESDRYDMHYGSDELQIHADAMAAGERAIIIDDLLATGGTAAAAVRLVERLGGKVAGFGCLVELRHLGGRERLEGVPVVSLITEDSPGQLGRHQ